MSNPDQKLEVLVQGVEEWPPPELACWATGARFHARRVDGDYGPVLTARRLG